MRTLASEIQDQIFERNQRGNWIPLFDVQLDDDRTRYLTNFPETISYNGNDYLPFPMTFGEMEETSQSELPSFDLSVANIDKSIVVELENQNIIGRRVNITHVYRNPDTAVITNAYTQNFDVLSAAITSDKAFVSFRLGRINFFQSKLPRNRWADFRCGFVFRGINRCHYGRDEFLGTSEGDFKIGGDGEKWQGWYLLNSSKASAIDVNQTTTDYLTVTVDEDVNAAWAGTPDGPFIYRIFEAADADIDIEARFDSTSANESTEGSGLVISEDSDSFNDYVGIFKRYSGSLKTIVYISVAGSGSSIYSAVSSKDVLRIRKIAGQFTFFERNEADTTWAQVATYTHSGLSGVDIRTGISTETNSAARSTAYSTKCDYFHLLAGGPQVCDRTLSRCDELRNIRRFGGAPGILHGPLRL